MKTTLISFLLLFLSASSHAISYTREITEKDLQKSVAAFMPVSQKNTLVDVTIKDPLIDIEKNSNKIALHCNILATLLGQISGTGAIDVAGNVVYDSQRGAFFLQNIEVRNFTANQISEQYRDVVKLLAQEALNKALRIHPIYQLDTSTTEGKLIKSTLKSVKVKDEKLLLKLGL